MRKTGLIAAFILAVPATGHASFIMSEATLAPGMNVVPFAFDGTCDGYDGISASCLGGAEVTIHFPTDLAVTGGVAHVFDVSGPPGLWIDFESGFAMSDGDGALSTWDQQTAMSDIPMVFDWDEYADFASFGAPSVPYRVSMQGWTADGDGPFSVSGAFNISAGSGVAAIPLPAGMPLLLGGLAALLAFRRRRA